MSDSVRPEGAFGELERLVRHLGGELAMLRRRAQQAETRLRTLEARAAHGDLFAGERVDQLERENTELRARLTAATERTRQLLDRVHFIRQQHERGGER